MKIEFQLIGNSLSEVLAKSHMYRIHGNRYIFYGNEIQNFLNIEADSSEIIINRESEEVNLIKIIFPKEAKEKVKAQLYNQAEFLNYYEVKSTKSIIPETDVTPLKVEQWKLDSGILMNLIDIDCSFFKLEIFSSGIA